MSIANNQRMTSEAHVACCGGGSGGHLFPAIAVAEELLTRLPEIEVTFLTSGRDIDRKVLNSAVLKATNGTQQALPVNTSVGKLGYGVAVCRSFMHCRTAFLKRRPGVVVGLGGFASIPGVLAAAWMKIPILLLETNVIPGAANRLLSRFAKVTFAGWPMAEDIRASWKSDLKTVGVPLRQAFHSLPKPAAKEPTLVILGGSQGAESVNALVSTALSECQDVMSGWRIVHQTGSQNAAKESSNAGLAVERVDFIDNLPQLLREAQVVITRCGAVTLAEIAASGCHAVMIPLGSSADGHQQANAEVLRDFGIGTIIDEGADTAVEELSQAIRTLCSQANDGDRSRCSAERSSVDASIIITDFILQLLKGSGGSADG